MLRVLLPVLHVLLLALLLVLPVLLLVPHVLLLAPGGMLGRLPFAAALLLAGRPAAVGLESKQRQGRVEPFVFQMQILWRVENKGHI